MLLTHDGTEINALSLPFPRFGGIAVVAVPGEATSEASSEDAVASPAAMFLRPPSSSSESSSESSELYLAIRDRVFVRSEKIVNDDN